MMKLALIFIISVIFNLEIYSQITKSLTIVDSVSHKPISFVNVRVLNNKTSTLSDVKGSLVLKNIKETDSLYFSYLGYLAKLLTPNQISDTVYLIPKYYKLNNVTIKPSNNNSYWNLIENSLKKIDYNFKYSKAYFTLKSFADSSQIEMIEAYSNSSTRGFKVEKLNLKAGRFALKKIAKSNHYFYSQEIAQLIINYDFFSENVKNWSPFSMSNKKRIKNYTINFGEMKVDSNLDTIIKLSLFYSQPKKENYLNASIWINQSTERIVKCEFTNVGYNNLFFEPIRSQDKIDNLHFKLTFITDSNHTKLEKIYFDYNYLYISFKDTFPTYKISSEAFLTFYDYKNLFHLPSYHLSESISKSIDYDKINSFPYNDFFWKYHEELKINSEYDKNQAFFELPDVVTNQFDESKLYQKYKLFQNAYIIWSENRIDYKPNYISKTILLDDASFFIKTKPTSQIDYKVGGKYYKDDKLYTIHKILYGHEQTPNPYYFEINLFIDSNTYNDSTHILTKLVYNPLSSYYYLPITTYTRVFFNLYFDLCQVEKIKIDSMIKNQSKSLSQLHEHYYIQSNKTTKKYETEVDMGANKAELQKWNELVKSKLSVDNFDFFQLKKEE